MGNGKKGEKLFILTVKEARFDEMVAKLEEIKNATSSNEALIYELLPDSKNLKKITLKDSYKFIKVACNSLSTKSFLLDYCDYLNGYLSDPPEKLENYFNKKS